MTDIIISRTPTLDAIDDVIAKEDSQQKQRPYLGASSIGHQCKRKSWFDFRWFRKRNMSTYAIKCIQDGHDGEILQAQRLSKVSGIQLITSDDNGDQFEFSDIGGHFRGHPDGIILGILESPKTWHIWEHKQKDTKFFNQLKKLIDLHGEKESLFKWDYTYYIQAILYMYYLKFSRHYMTISTPGGREQTSCRTESNNQLAKSMRQKAFDIIQSRTCPDKITDNKTFFICKMCDYNNLCHGKASPQFTCRSCIYSIPIDNGKWFCEKQLKELSYQEQISACDEHQLISI